MLSRKDQTKLLLVHLLLDDPFVKFAKETKVPLVGWSYINAIRLWRDRLNTTLVTRAGNIDKTRFMIARKVLIIFNKLNHEEIYFVDYLNFLLALAEDIRFNLRTKAKDKKDLPLIDKIVENLFKLYQVFDSEINLNVSHDWGIVATKMIREVF